MAHKRFSGVAMYFCRYWGKALIYTSHITARIICKFYITQEFNNLIVMWNLRSYIFIVYIKIQWSVLYFRRVLPMFWVRNCMDWSFGKYCFKKGSINVAIVCYIVRQGLKIKTKKTKRKIFSKAACHEGS